jgi:PLP dependent protein
MSDAATRLEQVRAEIARAARLARRDPADITLVAVSKRRSVAQIEALIAAGQRDFGESRVQEVQDKWPALRSRCPDLRLHMIGQLQSNKAAEAAALFDVIHSLDRPSLLSALAAAPVRKPTFVQVNIGEEAQKGGIALTELVDFLAAVRASPVPLAGLMAIPPLGLEPGPFFAFLAELAHRHNVAGLSMGMSSDYATAVTLGATVVRVGTALFENDPSTSSG